MPFTLAHPVAVLPFARCRRVHFPAMVIGSLAPDFVYFLHGRAVPGGHGLADLLWPNLPLCFTLYALYLALWHHTLRDFLPNCLNAAYRLPESTIAAPHKHRQTAAVLFTFVFSALFGMITHLFLDAFTHPTGWFVQHFAPLQQPVFALPAYKWLQCRPPPAAPLGQNRAAEKSFLGKLRPADALRLGTLANRRAYPINLCRHANHPPHRLRRARIHTALRGTALSSQVAPISSRHLAKPTQKGYLKNARQVSALHFSGSLISTCGIVPLILPRSCSK